MNPHQKTDKSKEKDLPTISFLSFISSEFFPHLYEDSDLFFSIERYNRVLNALKIPLKLEKFMLFSILIAFHVFLFIFTILPIRLFALSYYSLLHLPFLFLRFKNSFTLSSYQICDTVKCLLIVVSVWLYTKIDVSVLYHQVRVQDIIKLYFMYNMLEVIDKLCSSFGHDLLESLYCRISFLKSFHVKLALSCLFHFIFCLTFTLFHSALILLQIIILNVAVNSHHKALLSIMLSNNFIEIKGSVFKKFEKTNLFQMSCSDARERFFLSLALFLVMINNLNAHSWQTSHFVSTLPDVLWVILSEVFVDWIKHAFITKFNDIAASNVYTEYMFVLAKDLINGASVNETNPSSQSQVNDLICRRTGFDPIPLSIVTIVIVSRVFKNNSLSYLSYILCFAVCVTVKFIVSYVVYSIAYSVIAQKNLCSDNVVPNSSFSDSQSRSSIVEINASKKVYKNLEEVTRYEMCSNRIV